MRLISAFFFFDGDTEIEHKEKQRARFLYTS